MGDTKMCHLHLAKNMKELNNLIEDIPKSSSPKLLVNTAQKLAKEASLADKSRDEERAYLMYMRYFMVVTKIQQHDDYKNKKKYYDGLLDPKTTVRVIQRAEDITKSLERRYGFASGAVKAEKMEEEKALEKKEKEAKAAAAKAAKTTLKALPTPMSNGVAEEEGFMPCNKLYSLMKEKCSSYLILDTRTRAHFQESHMTLPNVISVPEEILRPGLTAGRLGNELDENGQTQWIMQRHCVDYLVMVDWLTEHMPLPKPLQVLSDAMLKWDPGKQYRSVPLVLQGGYDLWRLMYPMYTTNARVEPPPAAPSKEKNHPVVLNFDYPSLDLNDAFLITPSPPATPKQAPSGQQQPDTARTTPSLPQINRTLKPKSLEKEIMDTRNNNIIPNAMPINNAILPQEDSPKRVSLGSNVNTWDSKETNIVLEQQRRKQNIRLPDKVDNAFPNIPSRSLKPKDLLASLAANKSELEEEQKLLEESMKIEEDTIKKMEEMEAMTTQRETTSDEHSKAKLQATEDKLREDIRKLEGRSLDMEERYNRIQKQNEELWKMVNQVLANQLSSVNLDPTTPPDQEAERRQQEEEQEQLRKQKDQKRALQEQVEQMRRERKEKEKKMKEQEEREKVLREQQKARELEAERLRQEERKSRIDAEARSLKSKGTSGSGETYTTKLKGSPRSSPIRGSSNLRRSHSAFNLSQQDEEISDSSMSPMPNFDRTLKPLVTPQRRNINAARQRNFEPKYGSVPPAKTGLKNLGNTCYMNSIIQCLNNTKLLVKYFLDGTYSSDINPNSKCDGDVAEEVGAVVRALWSGQYRSIAMWDLKNAVGRYHRPFLGYDQHDSHEFLLKLMDWLNDDLNKVTGKRLPMKEQDHENVPEYVAADKVMEELRRRDQSILSALFHGLHRCTIECGTCRHVSLTFESFSVLSLSFPTSRKCSLRDLLHHYYKETNLEYKCCKCKKKRNCVRKMDIWKLPPVLVLHLNRFEHDVLMKKKQNFVDFPIENLDMTKLTCFSNRYTKYDLYAVCNHYGTMDGGHYTAFCRSPTNNKTWYRFDDHEVYELTNVRTSAAYLLFYEATSANIQINSVV